MRCHDCESWVDDVEEKVVACRGADGEVERGDGGLEKRSDERLALDVRMRPADLKTNVLEDEGKRWHVNVQSPPASKPRREIQLFEPCEIHLISRCIPPP